MASRRDYQLAVAVDTLLLWGRLGGAYCAVALIAYGFLSLMAVPDWVAPTTLAIALLIGLTAALRLRPFLVVRKHGVPMEGRVTEIKERRVKNNSDGGSFLKKRLVYSYEYEGVEYRGQTTWGSSGRFGTLDTGNPIQIIINPRRPAEAVWIDDMPIKMPQVIGM
ncbi:DUF3592 domain-containing protein [Parahaliea maris]|uniref:DUF3592 domain-containing protein n=1 Tax=Parahaliea maris TaxID=2716870 RepID=A0A5C9A021_9GAMM|nr:DUF3592 domain-containing protein [Parahaliea maris]TXS94205.1 DUF3592 domain-containing protein [Parahaliea maris]